MNISMIALKMFFGQMNPVAINDTAVEKKERDLVLNHAQNLPLKYMFGLGSAKEEPPVYRIAGKFGEFGESSMIRQTKTIQIFTYNYYLMAESIHSPNFSSPNAHNSEIRQTFSPPNFPAIRYVFLRRGWTHHFLPNSSANSFAISSGKFSDSHRFMQDNDPKHCSRLAQGFYDGNGINWWRTPPESPDLNPIESLWQK